MMKNREERNVKRSEREREKERNLLQLSVTELEVCVGGE